MKAEQLFSDSKLKQFGNDYVEILIKYLIQNRKESSNKLINSLNSSISKEAEQINIIIKGENYLEYVDKGRKPGSFPPISEIAKWTRIKGIPQSAAFPIAKSIFKFGIKPTNVINKTIKDITSSKFIFDIEKEVAKNIELKIKETIEQ